MTIIFEVGDAQCEVRPRGLFRKATSDGSQSVTAAIFWLKPRSGWRETPQNHEVELGVKNPSDVSDAERERLIATLATTIADGNEGPAR